MAPTSDNPETPGSVEKGQPTEKQSEKPPEPPFTRTEQLTQQSKYIDETLADLRPAAQEDKTNLGQVEGTFQREFQEPPAEFTEEPHTVKEVGELESRQQEITKELNPTEPERQPQPETNTPQWQAPEKGKVAEQPVAEKRPPLFHEAPIKPEATREQIAEQMRRRLDEALDKIYTEAEDNNGQLPKTSTGIKELKNIFRGSRIVWADLVETELAQLRQSFKKFRSENGRPPSRAEFKTMGLEIFREEIGKRANENPHEINQSPFLKQQEERTASHNPGRSPEIPTQKPILTPQSENRSRLSNRE